jgi:Ni2+-binding GTPase involved in maturation of urease and hydrogenase
MHVHILGGFLGSGKTTAINHACNLLQSVGKRVGVITNDQGTQLVDTAFINHSGIATKEVTGSCFCCNFEAFEKNIAQLEERFQVDVIFAESVGSCTDLVSTILNPLSTYHQELGVTLSVFADAAMLPVLIGQSKLFKDSVNYIYKKQLEEADIIVVNKIDLLSKDRLVELQRLVEDKFPHKKVIYQNSLDEKSILHWLDQIGEFNYTAERTSLNIDYDIYGEGEAALTWLDYLLTVQSDDSAHKVCELLMKRIHKRINDYALPIGHLKFLIRGIDRVRKISFTALSSQVHEPKIDDDWQENRIEMLINARIQCDPIVLKTIVNDALSTIETETKAHIELKTTDVFLPGYPRPTHRIIT